MRKVDDAVMKALVGGGAPPGDDRQGDDRQGDDRPGDDRPVATLADFIGTVQRMERDDATSLKLGAARDAYLQGDGNLVVLYADKPSRRGPETTLDYVLSRADERDVQGFRRASQAAATKGADLDYLTELVLAGPDRRNADRRSAQAALPDARAEGVVGVVRLPPTPAMLRLLDGGRASNDLAALFDDRFLLVDGLGRPRKLGGAAAQRADKRIKAKTLAYLAGVLGRHARLVRSARASAKMCVEGSEDDHGCVRVPSRVFLP